MQPASGRSRGRARTSARPDQPAAQPGAEQVPIQAVAPLPSSTIPVRAASPQRAIPPPIIGRSASPQRVIPPPAESGRGRAQPTSAAAAAAAAAATAQQPAQAGGQISPVGSAESPSESPPQQLSPQHPGGGRSAIRGSIHQPGVQGLIEPITKLALRGEGDDERKRKEFSIESVTHTRPANCTTKIGEKGTPIKLLCNYFEAICSGAWSLIHYHVDYAPPVESKRVRKQLFQQIEHLVGNNKAFDGGALYTLDNLPSDNYELQTKRESDGEVIIIKFKKVDVFKPTSPNFVHLFNLLFRKCLKIYGMKEIDRNYYDMRTRKNIYEYNLDLINGFSTSIANYENRLLLCAEITNKLLHRETILQVMEKFYKNSRSDAQFRETCQRELIGRVVMTTYNDKTYRIDDIDFGSHPTDSFETSGRSPTKMTFIEYYKRQYDKNIQENNQPMLVSNLKPRDKRRGLTTPFLLVPELCVCTGVDEKMRTDFKFKKAVEKFSKLGPDERLERLSTFVGNLNQHERVASELNNWRIRFGAEPCSIKGRQMPSETLGFGGNKMKEIGEKADWGMDMKGLKMLSCVPLYDWILVYPRLKKNVADDFVKYYGDCISGLGIDAEPPYKVEIAEESPTNIINGIKSNLTIKGKQAQMVVILLTSKTRKDRYDAVKRLCCLELPVPSQVVTTPIIEDVRKARSVVTKVAIQMNCKLGGEVWKTNIPLRKLMICGIDTYHDSEKKKSSVCAFIATSNETHTRYFSRATIQETHQELSNNLTLTVKSACDHYFKVNNYYPEKIIIYRDGVGDGQLSVVQEFEIPQILKAFEMCDPNYKPLLGFVVVKKRGNARFFQTNGALRNPPCGTVIDTVVTRAEWYDFYLISQVVTQGTVNPTHYNIIYDTIGLKPDHYQTLSYKLTHMYFNWPGTIRVPATCQYAHKLAFLVGQSLHKEHHLSLCDKLFYL